MSFLSPASFSWGMEIFGVVAAFGVALWLRFQFVDEHSSILRLRVRRSQQALQSQLTFVRSPFSVRSIRVFQGLCMVAPLSYFVLESPLGFLFFLGMPLPHLLLQRARQKRVEKLESQMESFLASLASALEAAPSLGEALASTALMSDAPLSEELAVLNNEMHLGQPLHRALNAWSNRVNSRMVTLTLVTLQVGRQTGGRLPHVLKEAASSLREITRLEGVLRTKTAEGRIQGWVISILPLPLIVAVRAVDQTYFDPLKATITGHTLIAVALILWVGAIVSAQRILAVEM